MKLGQRFLTCGIVAALGASAAFAQVATGDDDILNRLKGRSYAPNAVLVAFHSWAGPSAVENVLRSGGFKVDPQINSPYFVRLIIPSTTRGRAVLPVLNTIELLRMNPAVRVAEPDMQITPDDIPMTPALVSNGECTTRVSLVERRMLTLMQ